jgi:hypothetical protein
MVYFLEDYGLEHLKRILRPFYDPDFFTFKFFLKKKRSLIICNE